MMTVDAALLDRLPELEIIAVHGVGHDGIDRAAVAARSIRIAITPDILTEDVADQAIAHFGWRSIGGSPPTTGRCAWATGRCRSAAGRAGGGGSGFSDWAGSDRRSPPAPRRSAARSPIPRGRKNRCRGASSPIWRRWRRESDVLFLAAPGGAGTRGGGRCGVLERLGPEGVLVNIARGSLVDEDALVAALESHGIAGRGGGRVRRGARRALRAARMNHVVLAPHQGSANARGARGDGGYGGGEPGGAFRREVPRGCWLAGVFSFDFAQPERLLYSVLAQTSVQAERSRSPRPLLRRLPQRQRTSASSVAPRPTPLPPPRRRIGLGRAEAQVEQRRHRIRACPGRCCDPAARSGGQDDAADLVLQLHHDPLGELGTDPVRRARPSPCRRWRSPASGRRVQRRQDGQRHPRAHPLHAGQQRNQSRSSALAKPTSRSNPRTPAISVCSIAAHPPARWRTGCAPTRRPDADAAHSITAWSMPVESKVP